jgi:S-adenosylmethionine decarboxylase
VYFEGPEKKLEIILERPFPGLRANPHGRWERVVNATRAEIISKKSTERLDAYLLSESSLFVWDDRVLMITCGKTTLVRSLPEILSVIGRSRVAFVFYERKNLMFPNEQPSNFEEDVDFLSKSFSGVSCRLGSADGDHVHVFYACPVKTDACTSHPDATLQVLMHDLDPSAAETFTSRNRERRLHRERLAALERIYPQTIKDRHFFSPYGYSLNGIAEKSYFTVHVTPQRNSSYASFETNMLEDDYSKVIHAVTSVFDPGRFCVMLTTSLQKQCAFLHGTVDKPIKGYRTGEKSVFEFEGVYRATLVNQIRE